METVVVTGGTGQDGSYLIEKMLEQGRRVVAVVRRSANSDNINKLKSLPSVQRHFGRFKVEFGDITDSSFIAKLIKNYIPEEYYNLAAMSFVKYSFDNPVSTMEVNANAVAMLVNTIERFSPYTKLYQASTSEMFGGKYVKDSEALQSESTPFFPKSPYGVAKLAAHNFVRLARERGLFACCGILFNHESPRRGSEFVTQKICEGVVSIRQGHTDHISLGNLSALRDWGYAPEYVDGMISMLKQDVPDDYVLATGTSHSVKEFLEWALEYAGVNKSVEEVVRVSPSHLRPNEVDYLRGDATKANRELGWAPKVYAHHLVKVMVDAAMDRSIK